MLPCPGKMTKVKMATMGKNIFSALPELLSSVSNGWNRLGNPQTDTIHRENTSKNRHGILLPVCCCNSGKMVGEPQTWRYVVKIRPPHPEPLWNTISGLLPPTAKMVETGWMSAGIERVFSQISDLVLFRCPGQNQGTSRNNVVCRCLKRLDILKSASASFENVQQWSAVMPET